MPYTTDTEFRTALLEEANYRLDEALIDILLNACTPITIPKKRAIIAVGDINSNVYIIYDGIVRISYFNGDTEVTPGFASTGTIMLSPLSFMAGQPAHYGFYTCTECLLLRITRETFFQLVNRYHGLSAWLLNIALRQFCAFEMKSQNISGLARESYDRVVNGAYIRMFNEFNRKHPDIRNVVSSKDLAAYIGIKPSTLSNIRKEIIEEERRRNQDCKTPD